MAKYRHTLPTAVTVLKALSDENRLRAFAVLQHGELCVCQITRLLGLAPSTVSKHMTILKQAGLVESRKEGRWIYYRLADGQEDFPSEGVASWLCEILSSDTQTRDDLREIKNILRMDPEVLCKEQCKKGSG